MERKGWGGRKEERKSFRIVNIAVFSFRVKRVRTRMQLEDSRNGKNVDVLMGSNDYGSEESEGGGDEERKGKNIIK